MALTATLVWFRNDLRVADHPALSEAVRRGGAVIPVFIWDPAGEGDWRPGAASRWWLHESLAALREDLEQLGSRLILDCGPAEDVLHELRKSTGADAVFWNRRYEPGFVAADRRLRAALTGAGMEVREFIGGLLREPWIPQKKSGGAFQVFTAFWKHCLSLSDPAAPEPSPRQLKAPERWPRTRDLEELGLQARHEWVQGLASSWQPGTQGAANRLEGFLDEAFAEYGEGRDRPDRSGTSRLSPHLHFGEITPRQIWQGVSERGKRCGWPVAQWRQSQFLTELGWREFAHHLLYHFPSTPTEPLREAFNRFRWRHNAEHLKAWQRGRTGYPLVDAGMRELWRTGWMHNRVRMVVGSFLVKDLLISWREGADWFWDTLVDADLAQNTLGWQWIAGCGADAAPFFRIFNPVTQGEKFDPNGDYVRRWCPELAGLPSKWIHRPHEAPSSVLAAAGVALGQSYPRPIISHAVARNVALEAYDRIKNQRGASGQG